MKKIQELTDEQQLFAESAWLLYNNREKILADPRMAYAPIDMHHTLSVVDSETFEGATIGVYLEWWHMCENATSTNEQGTPTLVVRFFGNPLFGMNRCLVVTPDGTIEKWSCPRFGSLWEPFAWTVRMFKRDRPANLEPYTLEEVINKLKNEL